MAVTLINQLGSIRSQATQSRDCSDLGGSTFSSLVCGAHSQCEKLASGLFKPLMDPWLMEDVRRRSLLVSRLNYKRNRFMSRSSGLQGRCPSHTLEWVNFMPTLSSILKFMPHLFLRLEREGILGILIALNLPRWTWYLDIDFWQTFNGPYQAACTFFLKVLCLILLHDRLAVGQSPEGQVICGLNKAYFG